MQGSDGEPKGVPSGTTAGEREGREEKQEELREGRPGGPVVPPLLLRPGRISPAGPGLRRFLPTEALLRSPAPRPTSSSPGGVLSVRSNAAPKRGASDGTRGGSLSEDQDGAFPIDKHRGALADGQDGGVSDFFDGQAGGPSRGTGIGAPRKQGEGGRRGREEGIWGPGARIPPGEEGRGGEERT
jgi:hypothetical protein